MPPAAASGASCGTARPRPRHALTGAARPTSPAGRAWANPNPFWRRTAQRLLVERGDRSTAPALRTAVAGPGPLNLHALWTLHGLGELGGATHRHALAAPDSALRRNALRALGTDAASQQRYFVAPGLHDPDPLNRLVYLERLGDNSPPARKCNCWCGTSPATRNCGRTSG